MNGGAHEAGTVSIKKRGQSLRRIAPFAPYAAIILGLWAGRSAWGALLGYHAMICAFLTLDSQWGRIRDLIRGRAPARSVLAMLLGACAGGLLYLLSPYFELPADLGALLAVLGLHDHTWIPFIAYFVLVNPWLEELYWRGYLGSASLRPALNDLWFAGYHPLVMASFVAWPWMAVILAALIAVAWVLRQLVRWQRGLLVATLGHLTADLSIILVIYRLAVT